MSIELRLLALTVAAYVIGSIPFGLIVALSRGIDPRKAGSGNIGATNVGRLLGGKFFALVFALDLLKGLAPMLLATWLIHGVAADWHIYLLWLGVGFGAIAGHMFSLFLKFGGGKGVATSAGVMLGLWPYYTVPGLICIGLFLVVFLITRIVSISSVFGALAFPGTYAVVGHVRRWPVWREQLPLLIFATLMALMIAYKHRANLARLRAGTEHRIGEKSSSLPGH